MKIRSAAVAITITASIIGNICILPSIALARDIPRPVSPVVLQEIMSPLIPMSYADDRYLVQIKQNTTSATCNGHCYTPTSDTHAANLTSETYETASTVPAEEKNTWESVFREKKYDSSCQPPQKTASYSIVLRL